MCVCVCVCVCSMYVDGVHGCAAGTDAFPQLQHVTFVPTDFERDLLRDTLKQAGTVLLCVCMSV